MGWKPENQDKSIVITLFFFFLSFVLLTKCIGPDFSISLTSSPLYQVLSVPGGITKFGIFGCHFQFWAGVLSPSNTEILMLHLKWSKKCCQIQAGLQIPLSLPLATLLSCNTHANTSSFAFLWASSVPKRMDKTVLWTRYDKQFSIPEKKKENFWDHSFDWTGIAMTR